jgi:hypothetical protein
VGEITDGPSAPTSLVLDADHLTALEPFAKIITRYSADGVLSETYDISGFLSGAGQPVDVVTGTEEVFVLDARDRRILAVNGQGGAARTVNLAAPVGTESWWPAQLAYDSLRETFYVLDQTNSRILAYGEDGAFKGSFCSFGGGEGEISRGGDLVCDSEGWIYVADRYQGRIAVFQTDWTFAVFIDPVELGRPHLATPTGLAVDADGLVYVAATEGAAIHIFHIDKTAAPGVLLARPIDPIPGDTMPANDLLFVAGIQAPAASAAELVADFQVFDRADMATPVAHVEGLLLEEPTIIADLVIGSVSWQPDVELEADRDYGWRARARTATDSGEWSTLVDFTPTTAKLPFELEQNVPNPFNPMTVIHFSLSTNERAELSVYDIRGRLVSRQDLSGFGPGRHQVVWEGRDDAGRSLPSGIYFYRLVSGHDTATRKMVLAR